MKKILLLIFCTGLCSFRLSAQTDTLKQDSASFFTIVEQMPEFPGGETEMMNFLVKNIRYPRMAQENGISGKVWIDFIVDPQGKVTHVKVVKGIGSGCDEEAVRVIKMMPDWKPGIQDGRPVPVRFRIPVVFKLM